MPDRKTPPIEEQEWLAGPTVVDIGDIRVARGLSRRPVSMCRHQRLVYDLKERRIWCKDCETDVEAFDSFQIVVGQWEHAYNDLDRQRREIDAAMETNLIRVAAKRMDGLWRRKNTVPACPHCGVGLLPEDTDRMRPISKAIEIARRKRAADHG